MRVVGIPFCDSGTGMQVVGIPSCDPGTGMPS